MWVGRHAPGRAGLELVWHVGVRACIEEGFIFFIASDISIVPTGMSLLTLPGNEHELIVAVVASTGPTRLRQGHLAWIRRDQERIPAIPPIPPTPS